MKNIPIPPKHSVNHKNFPKKHSVNHKNFGFKSNSTPPQHELLSTFESDLCNMIRSINFKPVRNDFQKKLTEDINNNKLFENLLILADKTRPQIYSETTNLQVSERHLNNIRLF